EETKKNDSELLVVMIPFMYQVDDTKFESFEKGLSERRQAMVVRDLPQQQMRGVFSNLGIRYLDMLPDFMEKNHDNDFYHGEQDSHWNAAGNELAAEILSGEILRLAVAG
ncbi:MAG: hypothetical protein JW772_02275, partial [Candidatus Diapherotrites archaeon]|nr:hypothetical protein [Candidatus Diapherotrites archaeon]